METANNFTKKSMWRAFVQLIYSAKAYTGALVCAITGLLITRIAEGCIYKYLIPHTLEDGFIEQKVDFLKTMPFLFIGIFAAIGLGEFLAKYFMGYVSRSVVCDYRQQMLNHLLIVPMSYYKKHTIGELISKVNYDAEQVANAVSDAVREFLSSIIAIIVLFSYMLTISWQITLVILIVAPVVSFALRLIGKRMRRYSIKVQESMSELTHVSAEVIAGYQVIKIYQGFGYEQQRIKHVTENNRRQELKTFMLAALSSPIMQLIGGAVLVGFIYLVSYDSIRLPAGEIFGLIGILFALIRPLKQISSVNNVFQKGVAGAHSMQQLLQSPVEVNVGKVLINNRPQVVRFENVGFAYPDAPETPILHDISFSAHVGQTIALVGTSGSGKSSLMSLLPRFYAATEGNIFIDEQALNDIDLVNLRNQMALITQQTILFNDTVSNNIAYGQNKIDMEAIKHAAKVANALEFIEQLPQGFDTIIGENGCLLSGGQRQRLAIARAILKDAPILLLDEATSALDNESELAIKTALNNLMRDRITLVVAHRLSTIENADLILVLDKGRIVERGTHRQLIAAQGRYAHLQQAQMHQETV